MDTKSIIKSVVDWLRGQSLVIKIVAVVAIVLVCVMLLFSSCSSSTRALLPDVSENQFGAEGVVSKERNVSRQTKWYFKPPVDDNNVESINME